MVQELRVKELMGLGKIDTQKQPSEDEEFALDTEEVKAESTIPVVFTDVEEVVIPEIKDVYGRISDIIDGISEQLGIAVVPFEMIGVTPELVRLQRHDIFTLGDKKFAMRKEPRPGVVEQWKTKIIKMLSSGLPFSESLITTVQFDGKVCHTLALSEVEWTILMSMFRRYKQQLRLCNGNSDLILEIFAEMS